MGTIEFHIWGARKDRLDRPDRLVFDLDPADDVAWGDVRQAALDLRHSLTDLGLASVPVVTGGKGVHVCVVLRRAKGWDTVKGFTKTLAHIMAAREPDRFVATMSKARRKGRIYIDWLRNERGATAIAPYSLRARPGAPAAVPVTWDELAGLKAPNEFSMAETRERLEDPCPYLDALDDPQSLNESTVEKLEKWSKVT
jgi:bifunctional non-homologous end joining protein LigD